jgi:hypothetical protein
VRQAGQHPTEQLRLDLLPGRLHHRQHLGIKQLCAKLLPYLGDLEVRLVLGRPGGGFPVHVQRCLGVGVTECQRDEAVVGAEQPLSQGAAGGLDALQGPVQPPQMLRGQLEVELVHEDSVLREEVRLQACLLLRREQVGQVQGKAFVRRLEATGLVELLQSDTQ